MNKRSVGKQGEELAAAYLKREGYTLLEENAHERWGEIDLIARDPQTKEVVFVEVKLRHNQSYGHPEEAVNGAKLKHLLKAALRWLNKTQEKPMAWRVDVIGLEKQGEKMLLRHLKDVTQEMM